MDYLEISKLLIDLGTSGAILLVFWRISIQVTKTVEKLVGNHLEHIHSEMAAVRYSLENMTGEIRDVLRSLTKEVIRTQLNNKD